MFLFRDKYGVLHAEAKRGAADKVAVGEVVEMEGKCEVGYPLIGDKAIVDEGGGKIFVYTPGRTGASDKKPLEQWDAITRTQVKDFLKKVGI